MIVIGNKSELNEKREVHFDTAMAWAGREKSKKDHTLCDMKSEAHEVLNF